MNNKRILVYTEAAPVHHNVVAHGLHRAGVPIMRSIVEHIAGIAIFQSGQWFEKQDLDSNLTHLCVTVPRFPTLLCKALHRYSAFDFGIQNALPPLLLARAARRSSANVVLAFIGADVDHIIRGARLAAWSGKSYAFYLVDDFLLSLRQAGASKDTVQKATKQAREALRGASHVFTITDGLGEHLRKNYGVSSTTLPLAFEPEPRPLPSLKNQIIYVGGTNFLYADGLHDLFNTVERVRASGVDITVRLTVNAKVAARDLGELPSFVHSAPVETAQGLANEIASSLYAFLPYSFDQQHRLMVSTSFPSKSMEYLSYARSIVVYGPDYGVATQYFRKAGLPTVVSSVVELEEATRTHLAVQPDSSASYRKYLATTHSLAAVRKILCADLDLEAH
jgi:hypothetical protein